MEVKNQIDEFDYIQYVYTNCCTQVQKMKYQPDISTHLLFILKQKYYLFTYLKSM